MLLSARTARRAVAGAVGAGSVAGAMLFGVLPAATATAGPPPPNCTAADLAGVASGVSASTSAYLFTHPDVNKFFTEPRGPAARGDPRPRCRVPRRQPAGEGRADWRSVSRWSTSRIAAATPNGDGIGRQPALRSRGCLPGTARAAGRRGPHGADGRRRPGCADLGRPRTAAFGVRRPGRGDRQGSAAAALQRIARRVGARRPDARTRRRRGGDGAARAGQRHPDLRAVGARHRQRPHRRAGGGRRRLPDQAVRPR